MSFFVLPSRTSVSFFCKLAPNRVGLSLLCLSLLLILTGLLSSAALAEEVTPELDFIGGYYENGEYKCFSEPCFTIHKGTDAAAARIRPFSPREWQTQRGECQKSYTQVLADSSQVEIKYAVHEDCAFVVAGQWVDAYTGKTIDDIRVIALDHRISPQEAHYWGAAFWSTSQRMAFLNDPVNLVPVSIEQIKERKGRSPEQWMPERKAYWCDYIVHREIVLRKYQLRPSREARDFAHKIKTLYCKF